MPAYSFQEMFVPFVLDGSKHQTIRSRRKHPAKVGDTLYLYYGLRTKHCRKLKEVRCINTYTICITSVGNILDYGKFLDPDELKLALLNPFDERLSFEPLSYYAANRLAWKDGFRNEFSSLKYPTCCSLLMFKWLEKTHLLPFVGDIIVW